MKTIFLTVASAVAVCTSAVAQTSTWQIDPNHSDAQFAVTHMGISTVRGDFTKISGTVGYDPSDAKKDQVDVTIDTKSIDTRVEMRDNDLKSDHWFDVAKYPTITFKSTKVEEEHPGKLSVIGDLTMHGVTKSVELDVDGPTKAMNDGHGHLHMGVSATTALDRTQFGMTGFQGMVGNEIKLTIDAELVKPVQ